MALLLCLSTIPSLDFCTLPLFLPFLFIPSSSFSSSFSFFHPPSTIFAFRATKLATFISNPSHTTSKSVAPGPKWRFPPPPPTSPPTAPSPSSPPPRWELWSARSARKCSDSYPIIFLLRRAILRIEMCYLFYPPNVFIFSKWRF